MEFPKYKQTNKKGRSGLNILTKIVENELGWIVRPNHQEDDFGIDAYIDIIIDDLVTGKSIAIQVKSGNSYLKEIDNNFWNFRGEKKHLNYYLNQDVSVLIVLVDIAQEIAYWEACKIEYVNLNAESWTMPIPKNQKVNFQQREELLKHVSKNVDYVSQLEEFWNGNRTLSETGRLCVIPGKEDIQKMNYQPLVELIERICSNKLHFSKFKENIEIGIHGYDEDSRELFQVPEAKEWVKNIFQNVPGLSYFLVNDADSQFLKLFCFSTIDQMSIHGNISGRAFEVEYDHKALKSVLNILFGDLNDFTNAFKIPKELNNEISRNIAKCLTGKDFNLPPEKVE
jgi:hypothetical protein